ncbi:DNA-(apurinic or apyrimidinic site) lyase [Caligus rogercresseyi]|uniref:DNA-(Apurinic or apyrimidinic site) lyase n=1 Tax=Caligus rogercresseyi TaxID=217165 RepID=A0A7T8H1W4_CALRO|nr:DNA-(apurinic or apyrimidinic site) lyase [Caligus rogercresseyi]
MDSFLGEDSERKRPIFYDAFRLLYPEKPNAFTCWNTKINARSNNYGTRIDYFFINHSLKDFLQDCEVLSHVEGSDHCPIQLSLSGLTPLSAQNPHILYKILSRTKREADNSQGIFRSFIQEKSEESAVTSSKRKNNINRLTNTVLDNSHPEYKSPQLGAKASNPSLSSESASAWKALLGRESAKLTPPPCKGHNEPCVLRTVKKKVLTWGDSFGAVGAERVDQMIHRRGVISLHGQKSSRELHKSL